MFGGKRRAEIASLQERVSQLSGMDEQAIAAQRAQMEGERAALTQRVSGLRREVVEATEHLASLRSQIIETGEVEMLQEVGIYAFAHPLDDAVAYKARLESLKLAYKALAKEDGAVHASTNWMVNNSQRDGERMVRQTTKLMLRAYNAEADSCVRSVRPHRLDAVVARLTKAKEMIARHGKTMDIYITDEYHELRSGEIRLTADYLARQEEEKDRIRAEREATREEEKARREYEAERARLGKERSHYETAAAKLEVNGDTDGAAELRAKVAEIDAAIEDVNRREANTRAGFVYVISNIGAFGENMVKVGMTRRLDPLERVRELGDASVPFKFDVPAVVFSENAVSLESQLHQELAEQRVNRINQRREFFYAAPAEIRQLLEKLAGQHLLEYHESPDAPEWRASCRLRTPPGVSQ